MGWSLNGIRIFVDNKSGQNKNTIARVQPLSGGTVLQYFGYENEVTRITGKVVGTTDLDALKGYAQTHSTYQLLDYADTDLGDFSVSSFQYTQLISVCQTIRGDLPSDSPVFQVELELYQ